MLNQVQHDNTYWSAPWIAKSLWARKQKKAMAKEMGFSDAEISFDGNKLIIKANLSAAELAEMQPYYQLSSIPADAKIETIKDKTEYKVTMVMEGVPVEFHIKKD